MTNDEINEYITTQIMELCWHESDVAKNAGHPITYLPYLISCDKCSELDGNVDYCSDYSPRRWLNKVLSKLCDDFTNPNSLTDMLADINQCNVKSVCLLSAEKERLCTTKKKLLTKFCATDIHQMANGRSTRLKN